MNYYITILPLLKKQYFRLVTLFAQLIFERIHLHLYNEYREYDSYR